MSLSDAPWLQGLDGTSTWKPKPPQSTSRPSSVTHDAGSLVNKQTRIPRRSLSGTSYSALKQTRSPLATLNTNEHNSSLRRNSDALAEQNESIVVRGTVQQRAKSSSPGKKEATLEWRKRLLNGKLGYGDQTDLFGPSGLENIFAGTAQEIPRSEGAVRSGNLSWLPQSDAAMPSSPPLWPNNLRAAGAQRLAEIKLSSDQPSEGAILASNAGDLPVSGQESSVLSNPFELDATDASRHDSAKDASLPSVQHPRLASGIDRTVSGPTMLEQEDFSPVLLSKHTSVSGTLEYSPIKPEHNTQKKGDDHAAPQTSRITAAPAHKRLLEVLKTAAQPGSQGSDSSVFTDGPSSTAEAAQTHDLSLSENLPTGTPEPLGHNVQVKRGGYSTAGSFRQRPLSLEPSAVSHLLPDETSEVLPPAPSPPRTQGGQVQTYRSSARQTSFGDGQLNDHRFDARDLEGSLAMPMEDDVESDGSPRSDILVPGSKLPMTFQAQTPIQGRSVRSHVGHQHFSGPRLPSKAEQTPYPKSALLSKRAARDSDEVEQPTTHMARQGAHAEHKRPPASPLKFSTPKRRRTIHASELAQHALDHTREASAALHAEMSSGPSLIKKIPAIRPHIPTPSQATFESGGLPADIQEATDEFLAHEEQSVVDGVIERAEQSMSEADPEAVREQAEVVAAEVAKYTIKVNKSADSDGHGERKKSVTTQDFFREAELVMEYIRARAAKKPSLLASVEETENIDAEEQTGLQVPKSTRRSDEYMRVSREPSWENRPRSRWREPEQLRVQQSGLDVSRVASQLRKWQEPDVNEEQDVFLVETASSGLGSENSVLQHSSSEVVYDERAKIRITGPSSEYAHEVVDDGQPQSQRSQSSDNSTKRSDNVGTLAPDAVAHLIGSEVGGMTFDKEKQKWVRLRSPEHRAVKNGFLDVLESHLTSEDDPFREISDLAVDEGTEQRRISSPVRVPLSELPQKARADDARLTSNDSAETVQQSSASATVLQHLRPSSDTFPTSSVSDNHPHGSSAYQLKPAILSDSKIMHIIDDAEALGEAGARLHYHDDAQSDGKNTSTSAPEAGVLSRLREDTVPGEEQSDLSDLHSSRLRPSAPAILMADARKQSSEHPMRNLPRLIPDHDGRDISELSFVAPLPGDRLVSVSLSVSKQAQGQHKQLGRIVEQDSSPLRYQSSLVLSDLPDFTVHQVDTERASERALAQRFAQHAAAEVSDRFAAATKELVRALTDLYPEEPFWQELHDLDMRGRSLTSLHGLESFCDNVRGLDISKNQLTHLHGVPISVRRLAATNNQLSSLTSFARLSNLQYVNVSGNGLTSLEGFAGCVHLRELVADDNDIVSLEGITHLDLLTIRCRRNHIQSVQFQDGDLAELTELDLSDCKVDTITGLHHLRSLKRLTLKGNKLSSGLKLTHDLQTLQHLSLRDCCLSELDVTRMPAVQTLDVDDNALEGIRGLETLASLTTLSMRRQRLAADQQVDVFSNRLEAHTVRLSGNKLSKLCIGIDQLSLKNLELAAVGLIDLPTDFGVRMPNLRTLNLNFNSIKDLKPLLHVHALQDLQLYGNRLGRLRKTVAVLTRLPQLRNIDLRDNPLSQSFYAPVSTLPVPASTVIALRNGESEGPDEDKQQEELDWKLYNMLGQDADRDRKHVDRLDGDMQLRRRVYEMLIAHSCGHLKELDGLPFVKVTALRKDVVWHRLLELGVVRRSES